MKRKIKLLEGKKKLMERAFKIRPGKYNSIMTLIDHMDNGSMFLNGVEVKIYRLKGQGQYIETMKPSDTQKIIGPLQGLASYQF